MGHIPQPMQGKRKMMREGSWETEKRREMERDREK